jgi:hypothetical protein
VNVLTVLVAVGIIATPAVFVLLWRLLGPNPGTRASDGLASASPVASPYGSMILAEERAITEAEPAWLEDDRAWWRQFAASHPAPVVEAAFNQRGGWASASMWPPYDPRDGAVVPMSPSPGNPPWPVERSTSNVPGQGGQDVTGPGHGATGEPWTGIEASGTPVPVGLSETPRPGHLTVVPEVAHDEYAGPAVDGPRDPAAGPVPPWNPDLEYQDQDTALYLATMTAATTAWRVAFTQELAA